MPDVSGKNVPNACSMAEYPLLTCFHIYSTVSRSVGTRSLIKTGDLPGLEGKRFYFHAFFKEKGSILPIKETTKGTASWHRYH